MDFDLDLDELVADWTLVDDETGSGGEESRASAVSRSLCSSRCTDGMGRFINDSSELSDEIVDYVGPPGRSPR